LIYDSCQGQIEGGDGYGVLLMPRDRQSLVSVIYYELIGGHGRLFQRGSSLPVSFSPALQPLSPQSGRLPPLTLSTVPSSSTSTAPASTSPPMAVGTATGGAAPVTAVSVGTPPPPTVSGESKSPIASLTPLPVLRAASTVPTTSSAATPTSANSASAALWLSQVSSMNIEACYVLLIVIYSLPRDSSELVNQLPMLLRAHVRLPFVRCLCF
jgi:hypothetical protein